MTLAVRILAPALLIAVSLSSPDAQAVAPDQARPPGTLRLEVDATDVARRVLRVRQRVPVRPGALTLLFPQWIQGHHSPVGPIDKFAGLRILGNGRPIAWHRDALNVYAFRLVVPDGVAELELSFDMLTPTGGTQGRVVMTPDMLNVQWNQVVLYPAGSDVRDVEVAAGLKLPSGWQSASALEVGSHQGGYLNYRPVSLDTLLDSPVFAGRHYRQFDLSPGAQTPVRLNVFADAAKYLEATPEQIRFHRELLSQAYKLFGSHPFDRYDFLFSLSGQMGGIGLEHQRSSENGLDVDYFTSWGGPGVLRHDLLAHELVHAWNGKYRRPAGIVSSDVNSPLSGDLLWVYEGQTKYWGQVLAARSGLWRPEFAREALAQTAARYSEDRPGLAWRTLQDTVYDPVIAQRRPKSYTSYQLAEDYYAGAQLVWLAVDAKLRELSAERHSLDDFARAFFGGRNGDYRVKAYDFEQVVSALDEIVEFDWAGYLRDRLGAHAPPLDGLAASGWTLVYGEVPGDFEKFSEEKTKTVDLTYSLGMSMSKADSVVVSVRWDGPAFEAGIAPGNTVIAIDGYASSGERLKDAVSAAKEAGRGIDLLIKDGDAIKSARIDYRGGHRYPKLERIQGRPDRLSQIYAPR
ncbi:peptidase M61 [Lysobacter firmicutimachus]|uniref:Peptidase M61 n=1 Tax=Lysobacter firmicutimachus TaxID=1792846 RepID=A0AAU8MPL2_9GAMM